MDHPNLQLRQLGRTARCHEAHQHHHHRPRPRYVDVHFDELLQAENQSRRSGFKRNASQGESYRLRKQRGQYGHRQQHSPVLEHEVAYLTPPARPHRLYGASQRGCANGAHDDCAYQHTEGLEQAYPQPRRHQCRPRQHVERGG